MPLHAAVGSDSVRPLFDLEAVVGPFGPHLGLVATIKRQCRRFTVRMPCTPKRLPLPVHGPHTEDQAPLREPSTLWNSATSRARSMLGESQARDQRSSGETQQAALRITDGIGSTEAAIHNGVSLWRWCRAFM